MDVILQHQIHCRTSLCTFSDQICGTREDIHRSLMNTVSFLHHLLHHRPHRLHHHQQDWYDPLLYLSLLRVKDREKQLQVQGCPDW